MRPGPISGLDWVSYETRLYLENFERVSYETRLYLENFEWVMILTQ